MILLTVVLCTLATAWLLVRLLNLFSIPVAEASRILNISVPRAPTVSVDNVTADMVGLHWDYTDRAHSVSGTPASGDDPGADNSAFAAISHYKMYINGIEATTIPGKQNSVILNNLKANSHYQISLVAFNQLNFISRSTSVFVRTADYSKDLTKSIVDGDYEYNQVLPAYPKLLYEGNVDSKLIEKVKPLQSPGRSRSNTVDAQVMTSQNLNVPEPSEILNISDLKYYSDVTQEELKNWRLLNKKTAQDFLEAENDRRAMLANLRERRKRADNQASAIRQEQSFLEDTRLKYRGKIEKSKSLLASKISETEKKEREIDEFQLKLDSKQAAVDLIQRNKQNEFATLEVETLKARQNIEALIRENQQLEDAIKSETVTRKRLEALRSKLIPIFNALLKFTNNEGDLEKEGFAALTDLKQEHAEWFQEIKNLIDQTSLDRAHEIAQRQKLESLLEQFKKNLSSLKEETENLKALKIENNNNLLKNTYMNNNGRTASYTSMPVMGQIPNGNPLTHQHSIPSMKDNISIASKPVSTSTGWAFNHGRIPSETTSLNNVNGAQYDASSDINRNLGIPRGPLANEILNDDVSSFFNISNPAAMSRTDTFYSTNQTQANNPFGGIPDETFPMDLDPDFLNYQGGMRYGLSLDNNSLNLSNGAGSHGNSSPSYQMGQSPPSLTAPRMTSTSSNTNMGFGGINPIHSQDSVFLPMASPPMSEFTTMISSSYDESDNTTRQNNDSSRKFSFNIFRSNDQAENTGNNSETQHNSTRSASRFFRSKKPVKAPEDPMSTFNLSPGFNVFGPAPGTRDRSGSVNSHTSNLSGSIWNDKTNSASNFHALFDSPAQVRIDVQQDTPSPPMLSASPNIERFTSVPTFGIPQKPGPLQRTNFTSTTADQLSESPMKQIPTHSSTSNLSRQASNLSGGSSQQQQQQQETATPSSPSYFKKFLNVASPVKHEKTMSNGSNTLSVSGESDVVESVHGSSGGRTKLFNFSRKNSIGSSSTTSGTAVASSASTTQASGTGSANLSSGNSAPVNGSSTSNSTSNGGNTSGPTKKIKYFFHKRKSHEDGLRNSETEETLDDAIDETIEEASDESSSKE